MACGGCGAATADGSSLCGECGLLIANPPVEPGVPPGLGSLEIYLEQGRKASLGVKRVRNHPALLVSERRMGRGRPSSFPMTRAGWVEAWHAFRNADDVAAAAYARRAAADAQRSRERAERGAMEQGWAVNVDGGQAVLSLHPDGLRLDSAHGSTTYAWASGLGVTFPDHTAATIAGGGADVVLEFASPGEQRRFQAALRTVQASANEAGARLDVGEVGSSMSLRSRLPLTTLQTAPNRKAFVDLGLVTASVVMSRNAISDAGAQFQSMFGGPLTGVEKSLDEALELGKDRLSDAARRLGADAVVGVGVAMSGTNSQGDRSQLVVLTGTAILTAAQT